MRKNELQLALVLVCISLLFIPACTCQVVGDRVETSCYGNVIPCANVTYDLGSAARYWDDAYIADIYAGNIYGVNITSSSGAAGNITGTGTATYIPYWTSSSNLGNSLLYYDVAGGEIGVNNAMPLYTLDVNGQMHSTGDIVSDQDINAGNDVNVTNDLDVTDDATIGGTLGMSNNITMGTHYINNLSDPIQAYDAATKNYVDTMSSIPLANVHTVAKSGGDHTTIQDAINHAAPLASATSPQLIRIAPGVYTEQITLSSYVHLASVGGSTGAVIIQQTDADICILGAGVNNISGVIFKLVTPTQARTLFKDNDNANVCYLENVQFQITTPSTFAHKLISISGVGTVLTLNNIYASVGGTGASTGIDISSASVVSSAGMQISFTNTNAFNLKCTSASAIVSCMNTVLGGTSSLFNVTGGTFQWTGCRLSATGLSVINKNTVHYAENCFIDSPVFAQDGAEVRLRNCSYKYVTRTGTGNILDTSRKLIVGIFHVVDYTWNTQPAYANVAIRKSGTGDILSGGSGQGVAGTRLNSVSYAGIENTLDATGGLESSFNCTRTIRMHQSFSFNKYPANGKAFMGVRQTLGNAIPTVNGVENMAGFSWNGTMFRAVSSNGGGVGQFTDLTSPSVDTQHSFEMEILGSNRVDFYIDGVLVASHKNTAGIPTGLVDWQRIVTSDGNGDATYLYLTLRTGFIMECPQ